MIKKRPIIIVLCVPLLTLMLFPAQTKCNTTISQTVFSASDSVMNGLPPGTNFSIFWITDTQYLSESHPTYFTDLCRWIVNNAKNYNVKMVIHTGDIVQDEDNRTQWETANKSMSVLLEADLPYCWNAGNHDYDQTCWIGDEYLAFNPKVMATKPFWVDDYLDGQNTAVQFSVGDVDFLVVNVEYYSSDDVLDWVNKVLDAHANCSSIVGAHAYLNNTGGYGGGEIESYPWQTKFKEGVLDVHSNVFLTLSGHFHPSSGSRTQVGGRHELMFNRQDSDGQLGAASLRILSFDLEEGKIYVQTYLVHANCFLDDSNNQFMLTTTFRNDELPTKETCTDYVLIAFVVSVAIVSSVLVLTHHFLRKH
jgi:hypothetical protein